MFKVSAKKNKEILEKLSKCVSGHEFAKKVLITIINRSKTRYYRKWGLDEDVSNFCPVNCLLVGESGTGKTYLVESLSKIMNFPFVKIDATELTQTSAHGLTKNDVITKIKMAARSYVKKEPNKYFSEDGVLDQMVVFVDEIDKLTKEANNDWSWKVQGNFLTLFENKDVFDGITFIFAGAFSGINKREKDKKLESIGFFNIDSDSKYENIDIANEIIKNGLMAELVGRFNHIVLLDQLTHENYKEILNTFIIPKVQAQLSFLGVKSFKFTDEEIENLINRAVKSAMGVRFLESEILKHSVELEFYVDDEEIINEPSL